MFSDLISRWIIPISCSEPMPRACRGLERESLRSHKQTDHLSHPLTRVHFASFWIRSQIHAQIGGHEFLKLKLSWREGRRGLRPTIAKKTVVPCWMDLLSSMTNCFPRSPPFAFTMRLNILSSVLTDLLTSESCTDWNTLRHNSRPVLWSLAAHADPNPPFWMQYKRSKGPYTGKLEVDWYVAGAEYASGFAVLLSPVSLPMSQTGSGRVRRGSRGVSVVMGLTCLQGHVANGEG